VLSFVLVVVLPPGILLLVRPSTEFFSNTSGKGTPGTLALLFRLPNSGLGNSTTIGDADCLLPAPLLVLLPMNRCSEVEEEREARPFGRPTPLLPLYPCCTRTAQDRSSGVERSAPRGFCHQQQHFPEQLQAAAQQAAQPPAARRQTRRCTTESAPGRVANLHPPADRGRSAVAPSRRSP